jgi:formylglycine-generating enzyme required for sulfatase activity
MELRFLGDYELIKQIGQGSLGNAYIATHRFMKKQKPSVLKVLPPELATDRHFIQRFEEEVSLLSALDHQHIVPTRNVSFAGGQYFLISECVVDEKGETTNLAQYMLSKGKRLPEAELFRLLHQIAEALDYAHGKSGLAHRGIKLNNILVSGVGDDIDVKLTDFGLSRIVGSCAVLTRTYKMVAETLGPTNKSQGDRYPSPAIEMQKLTLLHQSFLQNFAFLAPEQKRLELLQSVDAKADVYAFGVLTYFLITGAFPEGIFALPQTFAPEYQWNWDLLVHQCLQADPAKRPEGLVKALERIKQSSQDNAHIQTIAESSPSPGIKVISAPAGTLKPIIHTTHLEIPEPDLNPGAALCVDSEVKQYRPERRDISNVQPLLTDMVIIPQSSFYRGSNDGNRDEMPLHIINANSYAIDIHPVTNEQFARFLEVMGGEKDSNHNDIIRLKESRIKRSGGKLSIESGYAKHPVVGVTWYGAIAYARWVGKRLPTEAEWEIAARGGSDEHAYPTGDDVEKTQANFFSADTTAVMSYAPNTIGLYDMAGNVYEWCYDWYGYNYYEVSVQEPDNPKGPIQGVYRVLRGGCWKSLKEDLRCSRRHRNNPGTVNGTYGFRCATDVQ